MLYQLSYLAAAGILSARKTNGLRDGATAPRRPFDYLGFQHTRTRWVKQFARAGSGENSTPISSPASVAVSSAALPRFTATESSPEESAYSTSSPAIHVGERLGAAHVVAVVGGDDLGEPARLEEAVELRGEHGELDVPEPVDVLHGSREQGAVELVIDADAAHEVGRIERRADIGERHPGRQAAGHRREDVAGVERARHRVEHHVRVRDLVRLHDPAARLGRRDQEAVVGADEQAAVAGLERDRPATRPDPRVDDRQVDADRQVRDRPGEDAGAMPDRLRADPVRDVDDLGAPGTPAG